MTLKIQCIRDDAIMPTYAHDGDVGMDIYLTHLIKVDKGIYYYGTGLVVEPPTGYYVEIHPRSSLPGKGWTLANSVGIIDPGYRGELIVALQPTVYSYMHGIPEISLPAKYAQLILRQRHTAIIGTDSLTETDRGTGGFGSTDK